MKSRLHVVTAADVRCAVDDHDYAVAARSRMQAVVHGARLVADRTELACLNERCGHTTVVWQEPDTGAVL